MLGFPFWLPVLGYVVLAAGGSAASDQGLHENMIVSVKTSGGFANITRTETVDTDALAPYEAAKLEAEVAAAGLDSLPRVSRAPRGGADYLQYEITVEADGKCLVIQTDERAMPDALRQLIDHVRRLARTK